MFKLAAVFAIVIAAASAGIIGHAPAAIAVAPAAHASSYANSNLLAIHPAPVAIAAHAAPIAVAAPVAIGIGHGGLGLGGLGHGGLALGGLGHGGGLALGGLGHGGYHG